MITLSDAQIEDFHRDGFLILKRFLDPENTAALAERFEPLFRGDFPTGLQPDEWNWREGRDSDRLARQICNGWKSDPQIAAVVLSADVGRLCATLAGWPGARIAQDNVIWKPPGASPFGFHQDNSYIKWVVPPAYVTCWIALDATSAEGGTIEYVRGSQDWGGFPQIRQFHDPDDYHEDLRAAAEQVGQVPEIVSVEVPAGGCAFHAGGTWHGSGANRSDQPRRSLVAHCISSTAQFHPTEISHVYSRYKRRDSLEMDESFFPVLWTREGYRTPWLDGGPEEVVPSPGDRSVEAGGA